MIFANFVFNGFSVFAAAILDRRYEPKMLVCNPIQSNEVKNKTYQFEENCTKIEDVRVPHLNTYKKAVMTSSNQYFQNLRKVSSQIFVKIMWSKFYQNRPRIVEMRGCDRHTHRHTSGRTDRGHPGLTYSVLKWLNIKTGVDVLLFEKIAKNCQKRTFFFALMQ